ncbi:phage head closure protein [Paenibacillus sp. sgz302251]|uniref:phage head closure protein n=1 Tax=Paenibacillus sp. sgz302251 TaxID=3414493 RepID=UPI003C7E95A6
MMWRSSVGLIAVTKVQNQYKELEDVDGEPREVMCNKKSVGSREVYQAAAVGMKPEFIIELMSAEYQDEPKLLDNGIVYHVIRTYSKSGEKVELTCSRYPMGG